MPYEKGGRADKLGNKYEIRWCIYQILKVFQEKKAYVLIEAIGEDEEGIDLWVGNNDGTREGQQCKGRYGASECWSYGTLNSKGIIENWKNQLSRNQANRVSLVSPLAFTNLEDLIQRARTCGSPKLFYEKQIVGSDSDFITFSKRFCSRLGYDIEDELLSEKLVNDLVRINYRQSPDGERKELLYDLISFLFVGDVESIYVEFVSWVIDDSVWGVEIDAAKIHSFLDEKQIFQRDLENDSRILPRIREMNQSYKNDFIPFKGGLIERTEGQSCKELLKSGTSLLIHGIAGAGKSGVVELLINDIEKESIPYIALKLDKTEPRDNIMLWSERLGLPGSIVHCLNSIAKNTSAVIILDQLDSLRWTSPHSRDALKVCSELVKQVENINISRDKKISIVFVCRTYDFTNDNNIKGFLKKKENQKTVWDEVEIGLLDYEVLKGLIGDAYDKLTDKLRNMLRVPSNLYIWQQLDASKEKYECNSTYNLVGIWWEQLRVNAINEGVSEVSINMFIQAFVVHIEKKGRLKGTFSEISNDTAVCDYLVSNGFLIQQKMGALSIVSFVHQSIFDYFQSEKMSAGFISGKDILEIVGQKNIQTPTKRYQFQMFMQNLLEFSEEQFLDFGNRLFTNTDVRFAYKFVFFEIIAQISIPSSLITNYIKKNVNNPELSKHIISNIVRGNEYLIDMLCKEGILEEWMNDVHKDDVIKLIQSVRDTLPICIVKFIESHIEDDEKDIGMWVRCFPYEIQHDSDELFKLRLKVYNDYPEQIDTFFNLKSLFSNFEMRAVEILILLLELNSRKGNRLHNFEDLIDDTSEFMVTKCEDICQKLLPYIPIGCKWEIEYSDWCSKADYNRSVERTVLSVLVKATSLLSESNPEKFIELYSSFMNQGSIVHNELILSGLVHIRKEYCNYAIEYIGRDFEKNIMHEGASDKLDLVKEILKIHFTNCSDDVKEAFLDALIHYVPSKAVEYYKWRIERNKREDLKPIYSTFWGDLQYEFLNELPDEYLSTEAYELKKMLNRRYVKYVSSYATDNSGWRTVRSPIEGKELSANTWAKIFNSKKLTKADNSVLHRINNDYEDVSLEEFARTFSGVVKERPCEMIRLVISTKGVNETFVDALYSGLMQSENIDNVDGELIEKLVIKYPPSMENGNYRAKNLCWIVSKKNDKKWSNEFVDLLIKIVLNHEDPTAKDTGVQRVEILGGKSKRRPELHGNAINCTRGVAAQALSHLLWDNEDMFFQIKDIIHKISHDASDAVKFASMFLLWPSYNFDAEWAMEQLNRIYKIDPEFALFPRSNSMFFRMYSKYKDGVIDVIRNCFESDLDEIIKVGSRTLIEMNIVNNEFEDVLLDLTLLNKIQVDAILSMVVLYFEIDKHREKAKELILRFSDANCELEWTISQLLRDNKVSLEYDREFIEKVLDTKFTRRYMYAFNEFLSESTESILSFSDLIFMIAESTIKYTDDKNGAYFDEDDVVKLIIGLYDHVDSSQKEEHKVIAGRCLDIWDLMFEKQVGSSRKLSYEMMQR